MAYFLSARMAVVGLTTPSIQVLHHVLANHQFRESPYEGFLLKFNGMGLPAACWGRSARARSGGKSPLPLPPLPPKEKHSWFNVSGKWPIMPRFNIRVHLRVSRSYSDSGR